MAPNPGHHDPLDDEVERLLADPNMRVRLVEFEARFRRGEVSPIAHAEVRRRMGIDPAHSLRAEEGSGGGVL